ncbi:DDE Tnp4 domain-containing protein [Citrus sinensis]|uniref:DDE Tnp4 domain-containing protein n=1 Tax=Citrus sinensis TaxID=2711 RepID=A0ACB8IN42_CITSI|nr:DDE Tnp4 domain-containing protein [Citrus sinensis]
MITENTTRSNHPKIALRAIINNQLLATLRGGLIQPQRAIDAFNLVLLDCGLEDTRVLREALQKTNGLNVPNGYYYLVDVGYANSLRFLAPYRGQRYHLNDWRESYQPTNPQEFFNIKHSSVRNVIERCFGMLKNRWAILRSSSFYPIKTQNRIITLRFWTSEEDIKLVESLLDLYNDGKFYADDNFKSGYLRALQTTLKTKLPGCGIKAKPHIESRIKTLKMQFRTIHEMLTGPNYSGFGWDPEKKIVTTEKTVWDAYVLCPKTSNNSSKRRRRNEDSEKLGELKELTTLIVAQMKDSSNVMSPAMGREINEKQVGLSVELKKTSGLTTVE